MKALKFFIFLILLLCIACKAVKSNKNSPVIIGDNNLLIYAPNNSKDYSKKEIKSSITHHKKVITFLEETIKYNEFRLKELKGKPSTNLPDERKKIIEKKEETIRQKEKAKRALELWKRLADNKGISYNEKTEDKAKNSVDVDEIYNYLYGVMAWREKIEKLACNNSYEIIYVNNICGEKIWVAAHYYSLDDQWVTEGWWEIPAYRKQSIGIQVKGRYFYIHAYSKEGIKWGVGKSDSIKKTVSCKRFAKIGNSELLEGCIRTESFLKIDIGNSYDSTTKSLTCN